MGQVSRRAFQSIAKSLAFFQNEMGRHWKGFEQKNGNQIMFESIALSSE
jgi:hypothetical protein